MQRTVGLIFTNKGLCRYVMSSFDCRAHHSNVISPMDKTSLPTYSPLSRYIFGISTTHILSIESAHFQHRAFLDRAGSL